MAWRIFSAGLEATTGGGVGAIFGRYDLFGVISGVLTGILILRISLPIYKKPIKHLLWYSPLSVYLSIAIYGFFIFIFRSMIGDFLPGLSIYERCFGVIFAMGLGVTIFVPVLVLVQSGAFMNHGLMSLFLGAAQPLAAPDASRR